MTEDSSWDFTYVWSIFYWSHSWTNSIDWILLLTTCGMFIMTLPMQWLWLKHVLGLNVYFIFYSRSLFLLVCVQCSDKNTYLYTKIMAVCEFIILIISFSFFLISFLTSIILLKYYDTIPYTKKNIVFYLSHLLVCDLGCGIMVLVSWFQWYIIHHLYVTCIFSCRTLLWWATL